MAPSRAGRRQTSSGSSTGRPRTLFARLAANFDELCDTIAVGMSRRPALWRNNIDEVDDLSGFRRPQTSCGVGEFIGLALEACRARLSRSVHSPIGSATPGGLQHIAPLVDTQFSEDHLKLGEFSTSSTSSLHRVLADKIERLHRVSTCPMRSTRPMRCSRRLGDQGRSQFTTTCANWRLMPSPPASVLTSTWARSRNASWASAALTQ